MKSLEANSITLIDMRLQIELAGDRKSSYAYFGDMQFQVAEATQIIILERGAGTVRFSIIHEEKKINATLTYSGNYLIDWLSDESTSIQISQLPMKEFKSKMEGA